MAASITEVKATTEVKQPDDPVPVAFTSVTRVCGVCALQFSKYKCPKCSVQTCGLMCYRAHGERCTESFYETQASDELRATKSTATARREMLATLARNDEWALRGSPKAGEEEAGEEEAEEMAGGDDAGEEEAEEGEEAEDERVERLTAMLEHGGTLSEEDLTPAERRAFRRQVADGSLGAALPQAPAWWALVPPGALEPCARAAGWRYRSEELTAAAAAAGAPLAPHGLPAMATLTSRPVPAALRFTVLEAVLSYTYCYRLFCGAPADDAADAAEAALALSCALRGTLNGAHASADEVLQRAQTPLAAVPALGPIRLLGRTHPWRLWAGSALPRRRGRATGRAPPLPRVREPGSPSSSPLPPINVCRPSRRGCTRGYYLTSTLEPCRRCCVSPRLPTQRPACAPRRNSAPPACATARYSAPTAATSRSRWAHSPSSSRPRRARCVPARARRRAAAAAASGTAAAGTGAKAGAKVEAARALVRLRPKRRCSTRSARLHFCR